LLEQWVQKDNTALNVLFDSVFESVTDGIIVYDQDGKIVRVNKVLLKIFEALPTELIGLAEHDLMKRFHMSTEKGNLLTATRLPGSQIWYDHMSEQSRQREVYLTLHSGREIVVSITSSPLLDQEKQSLGCVSIVHDITEQSQKECHIFHAFTSLLTLIDVLASIPAQDQSSSIDERELALPIHIAGKSMTDVIAEVLVCKFAGAFVLEELIDRKHVIGVSGLSADEEAQLRGEAECALVSDYLSADKISQLYTNQVVILDFALDTFEKPHPTFGARYHLLTPMVMDGKLIGFFVIAKVDAGYGDVSEAYSSEEIALAQGVAKLTALVIERVHILQAWAEARARELAMHEANDRYNAFISMASHELRTPLTTFRGNAELALRRLDRLIKQSAYDRSFLEAIADVRQPLSYAISRTNLQERMITDMLDASRIQQMHFLKMTMQPFDLLALVRNTVADVRLITADRTIKFCTTEIGELSLSGDADRIGQVIFNYISNALKYSPIDHPIEVRLTRTGAFATVFVHDSGQGLSVESQSKVWERFYQVPDVVVQYKAGISGLGLGLYLSRKIIEQHHGLVGVQSVPKRGSTFWFKLPLLPTQDA
jgi:PAS domain S-box-containing protein